MMLIQHSVNSDWLFNTQSRVLQADWLILENDEKATLNINMTYCREFIVFHGDACCLYSMDTIDIVALYFLTQIFSTIDNGDAYFDISEIFQGRSCRTFGESQSRFTG